MANTKEALIILLDVSSSMGKSLLATTFNSIILQDSKEQMKRYEAGIQAIETIIRHKMLFQKRDEIGIVLFGAKEARNEFYTQDPTQYKNVNVLCHLDVPSMQTFSQLDTITPSDISGDILDGLIVSLDLLFRRTEKKRYQKRLMVITDAESAITDASDIDVIVDMIKRMECNIEIMGIDFSSVNDMKKDFQSNLEDEIIDIKIENERMLYAIALEVNGRVHSVRKAMEMYALGSIKTYNQVTKFRGDLDIGTSLRIPVFIYVMLKRQRLPNLHKESQTSFDSKEGGGVKMDRLYTTYKNPDIEIFPSQRIKAYRYGNQHVPFSQVDEECLRYETDKSFKILGFINRCDFNRCGLMGGVDLMIAEPNKPNAQQAISALVQGMEQEEMIGIARLVSRKNSPPKIVCLLPERKDQFDGFLLHSLPYYEDMRIFQFESLKSIHLSQEQVICAENLIDQLMLPGKDEKDPKRQILQSYDPENVMNPLLQRFYLSVQKRAQEDDQHNNSEIISTSLIKLPVFIERSLRPDDILFQRAAKSIQKFDTIFNLKEAVQSKNAKRKIYWSDMMNQSSLKRSKEEKNDAVNNVQEEKEEEENDDDDDGDDFYHNMSVSCVGSINPIKDFEALIASKPIPQLDQALNGLVNQIIDFLSKGIINHEKSLQCMNHLRRRCCEIHQQEFYNKFLNEKIKIKFPLPENKNLWDEIIAREIGLIDFESINV